MSQQTFEYEVAGRKFAQRPMVLAQWGQMMKLVPEALSVGPQTSDMEYALALEDKLYLAIAIALREEGKTLKEKDVHALAALFEEEMDAETAVRALRDFFDCNPIASLIEALSGVMEKAATAIIAASANLRARPKKPAAPPEG